MSGPKITVLFLVQIHPSPISSRNTVDLIQYAKILIGCFDRLPFSTSFALGTAWTPTLSPCYMLFPLGHFSFVPGIHYEVFGHCTKLIYRFFLQTKYQSRASANNVHSLSLNFLTIFVSVSLKVKSAPFISIINVSTSSQRSIFPLYLAIFGISKSFGTRSFTAKEIYGMDNFYMGLRPSLINNSTGMCLIRDRSAKYFPLIRVLSS